MRKTVFDGNEISSQMDESNNMGEYNSVRFWYKGEELFFPEQLEIVFYNDDEQDIEFDDSNN